jgi:5-methylcytosine-specific restriction enzyme subunit McrC
MLASSSKPTLYSCTERQIVPVPPAEFIGPQGKVRLFKEVLSRGYFDIDFRAGQVVLVAGRFVGLIPLNDDIVVEILPKANLADFAHVLEVAGDDPGSLHFFERAYLEKQGIDAFFPLIVQSLLRQLQAVAQEGILKAYTRKSGIHTFKPTINFSKTLQRVWARGDFSHSYSDVFEFTKDTPFNRLIKYALWFCGRYLATQRKAVKLAEQLEFYANLFDTVPLDTQLSFLPHVDNVVSMGAIPSFREYYLGIAKVCMLIARNRSVMAGFSDEGTKLLSFVINLEKVFEKYVRNVLRAYARNSGSGLTVKDGNVDGRGYLFHDSHGLEVRPDIVIARGQKNHVIADVKYKPRTTEADRYQIISHALALGARSAVSVLPAGEGANGLIRKGQIYDAKGLELFEYYMPLEGGLAEEEERMAKEILSLVPSPRRN